MGFLDRLRGGEPPLRFRASVEPASVHPGDTVTVRYEVEGTPDEKCRAVRVGLKGVGTFLVIERKKDDDGDIDEYEMPRSIDLHEEERELPVQAGAHEEAFTLPADAAVSSAGVVEWTAYARLDRKGFDKEKKLPIDVRAPEAAEPAGHSPHAAEGGLALDEVPAAVREGEAVTGHLTVDLPEDMSVSGVRIRLHRRCSYSAKAVNDFGVFGIDTHGAFASSGGKSRIVKDAMVAETTLTGAHEFKAGSPVNAPFSIVVPAGAGPTTQHRHARVEWRLVAVLDRRMRDDVSVSTPLAVH